MIPLALSTVLFTACLLASPQAPRKETPRCTITNTRVGNYCSKQEDKKFYCWLPKKIAQKCWCAKEKKNTHGEFNDLMRLGETYERAGRLTEAEDAYRRALELKDAPNRELALRSLERILNDWGFLEWWQKNRLSVVVWTIVPAIVAIVLWVARMFWRRKRRLKVYPLDAPDDANVPAAHLEKVAEYLVWRMHFYASKGGPIDNTRLPFVWPAFAEDLRSTLEKLLPGARGTISSWLAGWVFRPDFELRGTLAVSNQHHHIILSLYRQGYNLRSWEASVPKNQTHNALKDLVYGVLLYIKGEPG